jgi:hypothetical protein
MNIETVILLIRDARGNLAPTTVSIDFEGRKNLRKTHFFEGIPHPCHTWDREDGGQPDCYPDVLEEAMANGLNPHLSITTTNHKETQ